MGSCGVPLYTLDGIEKQIGSSFRVERLYMPFSIFFFFWGLFLVVQPNTTNKGALPLAVVRLEMCGTRLHVLTPDYNMPTSPQLKASVLKYKQYLC